MATYEQVYRSLHPTEWRTPSEIYDRVVNEIADKNFIKILFSKNRTREKAAGLLGRMGGFQIHIGSLVRAGFAEKRDRVLKSDESPDVEYKLTGKRYPLYEHARANVKSSEFRAMFGDD